MPDDMITLLVRFLDQGAGKLSKRAKREFAILSDEEVIHIENLYNDIFIEE